MEPDLTPKQQLVERLKTANNILVTVSTDPSVDQLAACIGLTIWLNKLGKHATAVFSGDVPSTIEFLEPESTLEKTTDSLRDFIIALDKSKADKLRYKVEDRVVKIFITPYRTSLSADDLEFSQGDFNVDTVVALGVAQQQDLDNAVVAHGRILHDATVISINTSTDGGLGSINWHDTTASSLCELVVDVGSELGKDQLDGQIATALLTGIVAETNRFSNDKTTPQTMSVSAELMSAGANQQLVATKLEGPSVKLHEQNEAEQPEGEEDKADDSQTKPKDDGTLEIEHQPGEEPSTDEEDAEIDDEKQTTEEVSSEPAEEAEPEPVEPEPEAEDEQPQDEPAPEPAEPVSEPEPEAGEEPSSEEPANPSAGTVVEPEPVTEQPADDLSSVKFPVPGHPAKLVTEPPTLGGTLTANSVPERPEREPLTDPLSLPPVSDETVLSHAATDMSTRVSDDTIATPTSVVDANQPADATDSPDVAPAPESTTDTATAADDLANEPATTFTPPPPQWTPPTFDTPSVPVEPASVPEPPSVTDAGVASPDSTLSDLEQSVGAHQEQTSADKPETEQQADLAETARMDLEDAYKAGPETPVPAPIEALNAQPIDLNAPDNAEIAAEEGSAPTTQFNPADFGLQAGPSVATAPSVAPPASSQSSAPPVPPPLPSDVTETAPSPADADQKAA